MKLKVVKAPETTTQSFTGQTIFCSIYGLFKARLYCRFDLSYFCSGDTSLTWILNDNIHCYKEINLHRMKVVKSNGMLPLFPKNNAEFSVSVFLTINPLSEN